QAWAGPVARGAPARDALHPRLPGHVPARRGAAPARARARAARALRRGAGRADAAHAREARMRGDRNASARRGGGFVSNVLALGYRETTVMRHDRALLAIIAFQPLML